MPRCRSTHSASDWSTSSRDAASELVRRLLRRVGLEDPRLRLDHLGQRPEGDAFAVGQRAALAPVGQLGLALDHLRELVDETALADPGNADEGDELRRSLRAHTFQRAHEHVDLALAADQRSALHLADVDAVARAGLDHLPGGDRLLLALGGDRLALGVVDLLVRGAVRRLVDEDPVDGSRGLQPGRRVHDVARGHALALGRPGAERDERLAGRDRDPNLEVTLLADPVADRERGADRALGVVLVRGRRAEQRHHRVADELLDRPAAPLELGAQTRVVGLEDRAHVLRIHLLGPRGEPDEVGEEDGHDLALLARRAQP